MFLKFFMSVLVISFVSGCASGGAPATQFSVDYDKSASWTAEQGADLFLGMLRRQQDLWDRSSIEDGYFRYANRSNHNLSNGSVDVGYSGRAHLYFYRARSLLDGSSNFYFTISVDEGALLTAYRFDYINPIAGIANMVGVGRGTRPMYVAHIPGARFCWGSSGDRPLSTTNGWALPVTEEKYNVQTGSVEYMGAVCLGGDPRFNISTFIERLVRRSGMPIDDFNRSDGLFVFGTSEELSRFASYLSAVYGVRVAEPI